MKKAMVFILIAALSMISTTTVATADVKMGQKIFKKKFRKKCRFSGVKFARHHTQAEWEEIWDDGKFQDETKKICPKLDVTKIKDAWWEDVYEFSVEYASDGVIPKC